MAELMQLLRTPCAAKSSHRRQVYRIHKSQLWGISYSGELPPFDRFRRAEFEPLIAAGTLVPVYPGEPSERDAYQLARA
jgi:hypothetical protein